MSREYRRYQHALEGQCLDTGDKTMPQSLENSSFDEIQSAYFAMRNSEICPTLDHLNWVMEKQIPLQQWEINKLEQAFNKFLAKYNSPLEKALK